MLQFNQGEPAVRLVVHHPQLLAQAHALLDAVLQALHQPLLQPILLLDHPVQQALEEMDGN